LKNKKPKNDHTPKKGESREQVVGGWDETTQPVLPML
jgi:hypothetical protein